MPTDKPRRRRDPMAAAEAVFKTAPAKPVAAEPTKPKLPGVKQLVSLRLDEDVIEHFQSEGRDWQDRINAALRKAMGT